MTMVADPRTMPFEQDTSVPADRSVTGHSTLASGDGRSFAPSVVILSDPKAASAEGVRTLRAHIMAQHVQLGRRALAVCATSPRVGCTFVAVNLAVALAQIGVKTLLIDANLRQPGVQKAIGGARPARGLIQCLEAPHADFSEAIDAEVMPNLSVIYSGGIAANPQELLAGERFRVLTQVCLRDFDVTIVDTPAANGSADASCVSAVVGYSLIVARRDKSFIEDLKTLVDQLRSDQTRVVGTVLNGA